jgi:sarcosine oxidase, subunit delta
MLTINCPWCGPRDETEFGFGGEAHRTRPADPSALSDAEWAEFLFMRTNPKGLHRERWVHSHGCRRWFNVERHTVTNEITRVYQMGGHMGGDSEAAEQPVTETAAIEKQGSRS